MAKVKINNDRCKGCGLCVMFCPKGMITLSGPVNGFGLKTVKLKKSKDCVGCGFCALVCPDCAIEVWK